MRILILGGTIFVGKHFVQAALKRSHDLTLFHRGQHGPELFPEVERIQGDRKTDLGKLAGKQWDWVLDTCGYHPRDLRASSNELRSSVGRYAFVSTISVYDIEQGDGPIEESNARLHIDDPDGKETCSNTYGGLKALCEDEVLTTFGPQSLIMRPGLIVGPDDPTDRFTYWPAQVGSRKQALIPDDPTAAVQFLDVRDLADFAIQAMERSVSGTFNLVGPAGRYNWSQFAADLQTLNPECELVAASKSFLSHNSVQSWAHLPLWVDSASSDSRFSCVSAKLAELEGLRHRSAMDTLLATWEWWRGSGKTELKVGLSPERQNELLKLLTT